MNFLTDEQKYDVIHAASQGPVELVEKVEQIVGRHVVETVASVTVMAGGALDKHELSPP